MKFAVLPASSKLTDKLFVTVFEAILAKFAVTILPRLALLNCTLPTTVNKLVEVSNVKFALAPKSLLLLNWICVLLPAACCKSQA